MTRQQRPEETGYVPPDEPAYIADREAVGRFMRLFEPFVEVGVLTGNEWIIAYLRYHKLMNQSEIQRHLVVGPATVRGHMWNIYGKCGGHGRNNPGDRLMSSYWYAVGRADALGEPGGNTTQARGPVLTRTLHAVVVTGTGSNA